MGVTGRAAGDRSGRPFTRWALRRPHVLLVACPGATALRLEAELALTSLGGGVALSPADADILLTAGDPGEPLAAAVDAVWDGLPGPRARVSVRRPGEAEVRLREAVAALAGSAAAAQEPERDDGPATSRHAGGGDGTGDGGDEGGGMEMPAGLPMAERAEDRDGLALDVLQVPLGPVLPHWPAGLVVHTRLQGDIVQHAEARVLAARTAAATPYWCPPDPAARPRRSAAAHLDSMARLLALTGWQRAEAAALGMRDRLVHSEEPEDRVRADFVRWRRRVERSRLLRGQTDGLGVLPPEDAARFGVGGPAARAGEPWDTTARWRRWLTETDRLLSGGGAPEDGPRGDAHGAAGTASRALLDAAVRLMPGHDLIGARLLLAGFDPDTDGPSTALDVVPGAGGTGAARWR